MGKPIILYGLIFLLGLACVLDIVTFLYFINNNNINFEINPLFILLKGVLPVLVCLVLVIGYKIAVNGLVIWMLLKYEPQKSHLFAFLLVFSTIIAIVLQLIGAYQNVSTHIDISNAPPDTFKPLSTEQSFSLWSSVFFYYSLIVLFEVITFMVYERLYLPHMFLPKIL